MKIQFDEKQKSTAFIVVRTFCICLLIAFVVWRLPEIAGIGKKILGVLTPILWGLVLSYLLNPMQGWIEKKLSRLTDRKKPHPRLRRGVSVALAVLILLLAVFGLIASIVPELFSSVKNLLVSLPDYLTSIGNWIEARIAGMKEAQPQIYSMLTSFWDSLQSSVSSFADRFEPKLDSIASGGVDFISSVTSGAMSIFGGVTDFVLGLIITVYLLYSKEWYLAQASKFLYAVFPEERVHSFLRIGSHVSYTFMHFLSGKTVDSLIIGLLCFIGMTLLRMPYITLISILIGVTNIIPFFGPFIGAIPSAFLILLSEPAKTIPFVIFILILQQFDGNFLGPKILGDTLGLPMFWILFAIVVGGGLFGFLGMVAFVPLFAAVYTLFADFLETRLRSKGLPSDIDSYLKPAALHTRPKEPPEQESAAPSEASEDGTTPENVPEAPQETAPEAPPETPQETAPETPPEAPRETAPSPQKPPKASPPGRRGGKHRK